MDTRGDQMNEHTYGSLVTRATDLARTSPDERDRMFWSTYANGMARAAANLALAASVWMETSTASDEFRSMKLAAIRKDVAYSWEASR
jgi:hypothetical protein